MCIEVRQRLVSGAIVRVNNIQTIKKGFFIIERLNKKFPKRLFTLVIRLQNA